LYHQQNHILSENKILLFILFSDKLMRRWCFMRLIEEILYRKTKGLHVQIVLPRREDELLPLIECGCTQMLLQIRDILEDPQMRKEGCARQIRYIRYLFADEGVLLKKW